MPSSEASKTRRIELILRQIDSLPTLPVVAARLLALTASDESTARDIMEVVSADQTLTAKILSLCRQSDRGIRNDVMTVDKAVVLLGFNAIRNAVLSIKVVGMFDKPGGGEEGGGQPARPAAGQFIAENDAVSASAQKPGAASAADSSAGEATGEGGGAGNAPGVAPAGAGGRPIQVAAAGGGEGEIARFDRVNFWRHSLAVAVAAELLAAAHPGAPDLPVGEAYVCGLLHDIGKLALDYVLPKSFARVVDLTDLNQGNIAEFERRILGLDHHTAGKRLAEQWQLPHRLQDCIWLHGSAYDTLPRLEHRRLIGLISLADLIARRQHLGYSGNFTFKQDPEELAHKIGLNPGKLAEISQRLHEEVQKRAEALGLENKPSRELFVQSIHQANQALGRLNSALDRRAMQAARQTQILDAITAFHAGGAPGRGTLDVVNAVAASAASVLGTGFYAVLCPSDASDRAEAWLMCQFSEQARPLRSQYIEPPPHAPDLAAIDPSQPLALNLMGVLPWIADYLMAAPDLRSVRVLPLTCGWGTAALLLHDRPALPPWQQLSPLTSTWGAAIAAASQHEGARRLGEDLAEANGALAEAQDKLLRTESLARLGEMAAGAAHEMNNPLAVISGRGQLLAVTLPGGSREQKAAQTICEQAHRLSDLITSLRLYSDPPKPAPRAADIGTLLDDALKRVGRELGEGSNRVPIDLRIRSKLGSVMLDPEQIGQALSELILNAAQAQPKSGVQVVAQADSSSAGDSQLIIQVIDDGIGMDEHTLAHAMDPFFSAKSAGRRIGMGLPRAQQLISAHNGFIHLRSTAGQGTTATITLPLDQPA